MTTDFLDDLATFNRLPKLGTNAPDRIDHFFQQFEWCSKTQKWSESKQKEMLPTCLTDTAQDFYNLLQIDPTFPTKTYDYIKEDIVSTFRGMSSSYKIDDIIRNRRQTLMEAPNKYVISNGQLIRSLLPDITEQLILHIIQEFRSHILQDIADKSIKTVQELISALAQATSARLSNSAD